MTKAWRTKAERLVFNALAALSTCSNNLLSIVIRTVFITTAYPNYHSSVDNRPYIIHILMRVFSCKSSPAHTLSLLRPPSYLDGFISSDAFEASQVAGPPEERICLRTSSWRQFCMRFSATCCRVRAVISSLFRTMAQNQCGVFVIKGYS